MKIGIISLGLIGGSLLKALTSKGYDICAVTRNPKSIEEAKKYTPNVSNNILTLNNCDIIFVCSPMNKTEEILDALESIVTPQTIVTDVCSLKSFITKQKRSYTFIGSHPMAGTENSGFSASFNELFIGAKWVLTPTENAPQNAITTLTQIIESLGATPIFTTAKEHDEAVAMISHMPLLLAQALIQGTKNNNLALKLAASGFRDMTRLALSNTEMANDMFVFNNENIKKAFDNLQKSIAQILDSEYPQTAIEIKNIRQNLYDKDGKNIYN